MSFVTDMNTVATAIDELFAGMGAPPGGLQTGQWGPPIITWWGHGAWNKRGNSNYFNCGVNQHQSTAPPIGEKGWLPHQEGSNMELWFTRNAQRYANFKPNVLKDGTKWNFVMVVNGCAFNFHLEVG
jgi:hypothetical protein